MGYLTGNTVEGSKCYSITVHGDYLMQIAFLGALQILGYASSWTAYGELEPSEMAESFLNDYNTMSENGIYCTIGSVVPFARTTLPDNFLPCDGTTYAKELYPDLWEVIAGVYKTSTTLTTPNLNARQIRGATTGGQVGTMGGNSTVTLTEANLPSHNHGVISPTTIPTLVGEIPSVGYNSITPNFTANTGSGTPFNILNPFTYLTYGIQAK